MTDDAKDKTPKGDDDAPKIHDKRKIDPETGEAYLRPPPGTLVKLRELESRPRDEQVDRPSRHARQAGDRFFDAVARTDEQRPDQIGGGQLRLAHHRAANSRRGCSG